MKTTFLHLLFAPLILSILGFIPQKKPITTLEGMKKTMKTGYSYIPSGNTIVGDDTISCQGFFMMKEEVTNFSYLEYLYSLKKDGKIEEYKAALPDTAKWASGTSFNSKYVDYYFRHPAYRDYPTVNVTKEQAEKYCAWLSEIWRKNTGNQSLVFRLPTQAEFLRAANGSALYRPYSWNSPYLNDEHGFPQCNFLNIGAGAITRDSITGQFKVVTSFGYDDMGVAGILSDHADYTAPAKSYKANEFGLYNLNGNVSEMVSDQNIVVGGDWNSPGYDIRNQSAKNYSGASPMVGFRPVMTFVETN